MMNYLTDKQKLVNFSQTKKVFWIFNNSFLTKIENKKK